MDLAKLKLVRDTALDLAKERMKIIKAEMKKPEPNIDFLQIEYKTLRDTYEECQECNVKIMDLAPPEHYAEHRKAIDTLTRDWNKLSHNMDKTTAVNVPSPPGSHYSTATDSSTKKRTFKLPKIELKKFNGELTEWLGWWSQFRKIHEDEEIHESDKFQYLLQSTVVGSRARDLVASYPMTDVNYPKVINSLQQRFGKRKLLKQVYVRELLTIVIQNSKSSHRVDLARMYDMLESHIRALEELGVTTEQTAEFLFPMAESSLPEDILIAWQRSPLYGVDGSDEEPPKTELHYLMKFLRQEVEREGQRVLVRAGFEIGPKKKDKFKTPFKKDKDGCSTAAGLFSGNNSQKCIFCEKNNHASQDCYKAQKLTPQEKIEKVREKRCCFLCLKPGHLSKDCKSSLRCLVCSKKHLVFMCPEITEKKTPALQISQEGESNSSTTAMSNHLCSGEVLLQTLLIRVYSEDKRNHRVVRLVFDNGSQGTSIRKVIANELGLHSREMVRSRKVLYGGAVTNEINHNKYRIQLGSLDGKVERTLTALDEQDICGRLRRIPIGPWLQELIQKKIWLSDFISDSEDIDILVGSDYYGQLMTGRIVHLKCGLTAMESVFGWTLSGKLPVGEWEDSAAMTMTSTALLSCQSSISDLWSLDLLGIKDSGEVKSKKEREELTKEHFQQTVSRNEEGRYSVRLPWTDGEQLIPNNRAVAEKRLQVTTKKLQSLGKYEDYNNIFQSWVEEGFTEEVVNDKNTEEVKAHYLPHRAVFKPESLTTPVRPVFDASCKTGRNPSLNDCLEKGPNLLELIPSLLARFREKTIGVTSDVRKAFQMIEVDKSDRDFLRFLWWEDNDAKKIKIFRHKRVVFGVNCSPFLLEAVIEKHLTEVNPEFQEIAMKLLKSLYVDNCVTSVNNEEEYDHFKKISVHLLEGAQMELRQWEDSFQETDKVITTVLGMKWDKTEDTIQVEIPCEDIPEVITKRIVLSFVQKIFDPLGFLSPATLVPKLILQKAWDKKTNWDEELDIDLKREFTNWWSEVTELEKVRIPRHALGFPVVSPDQIQIHGFGDASYKAYAAAVFIRVQIGEDVWVQLIQSKSRVAPLKKLTIPRLELLASNITARLVTSVKESLSMEGVATYLWSDSSTVLAWIRRNNEWGTFVGNRVKEICSLTPVNQWNFVPGKLNPADLPSRGCSPKQLFESRWWEGPEWLSKSQEYWPLHQEPEPDEGLVNLEKKKTVTNMKVAELKTPWYLTRYSSYTKNLRLLAWILRFVNCCQKKEIPSDGGDSVQFTCKSQSEKFQLKSQQHVNQLTRAELDSAELKWFHFVQKESFPANQEVISGLRVEKDTDGLLRVRSKLINRDDTEYFQRPVLLPTIHPLVEQLIVEEHRNNSHAGAQFPVGKIREKCWILQTRRAVKKVLHQCVICRRFTTKRVEVPSAPLPEDRVQKSRVFQTTGVDLAGPLFLKNDKKVWVVLFTCAVYRCVHLELVTSLSTDAFLLSLFRFISRRGRPVTIYSDNGTNFVGADNLFKNMDWTEITSKTRVMRIQWKFIVPSAPWWGGWWERLIRTIKDLLKRMLGQNRINYDQLETCICQVESVINERPLTYITEDGDDLIPLTPGMFLRDTQVTEYPEAEILDAEDLRGKYKSVRKLWDELRSRFRKEYLSQLIQRGKSRRIHEFRAGDVVLIGDDNKKRQEWKMGRVVEVGSSKDGHSRVATVKTSTSVLLRPLQRLYPLEVSSHQEIPVTPEITKIAVSEKSPEIEEEKVSQDPNPEENTEIRTKSRRVSKKPTSWFH